MIENPRHIKSLSIIGLILLLIVGKPEIGKPSVTISILAASEGKQYFFGGTEIW